MKLDFLSALDLGRDGLAAALDVAAAAKRDPSTVAGSLAGQTVGLFFQKPSTRTRVSCEVGSHRMGATPLVLKQDEVGLGTRESVEDVARVLDRYLDILAFRVFEHRHLVAVAENTAAPVINLLSDLEHPCQAVADLQTVAEHRPLDGAVVAYIGDGNNVCHSLVLAGALMGVSVRVASPVGYEPSPEVISMAEGVAAPGVDIVIGNDPADAVRSADAVYTDVWASMGQEEEAAERKRLFDPFQVDGALFGLAAPDAVFLHCLPAHRGDEVTDEVMDHERSRVFDQAENRMHSFIGVLDAVTG